MFKQHAPDLSLVLTDMMMPVLDGRKAIHAMAQIRPDMEFIAMTGMMQPGDFSTESYAAQIEVLRKPFVSEKILDAVARCLERQAPGELAGGAS